MTLTHRDLGPDDVFLASYPRSGSAYLRWLIVEMLTGEVSFPAVKTAFPYVGQHGATPRLAPSGGRLLKTHEQFHAVYGRAIHLVRDPRDVAISYFHFLQRIGRLNIRDVDDEARSFDRYLVSFIHGRMDGHGTWQEHLTSWLRAADGGRADILRVRYEDLRADTPSVLTGVAAWLGHDLDAERAASIVERCSLERMRAAEDATNGRDFWRAREERSGERVVREGRVGGWREAMTSQQQGRFAAFSEGLSRMGYDAPPSTYAGTVRLGARG